MHVVGVEEGVLSWWWGSDFNSTFGFFVCYKLNWHKTYEQKFLVCYHILKQRKFQKSRVKEGPGDQGFLRTGLDMGSCRGHQLNCGKREKVEGVGEEGLVHCVDRSWPSSDTPAFLN